MKLVLTHFLLSPGSRRPETLGHQRRDRLSGLSEIRRSTGFVDHCLRFFLLCLLMMDKDGRDGVEAKIVDDVGGKSVVGAVVVTGGQRLCLFNNSP